MKTTTTTSFPKRLSSLGKLDKGKYVEQYIRSQKSVRVLEVIPEQVNQTSQDASNPLSHLSSTKKNSIVNDGFRTPTLKPRIPKVQISEFPTSSLKRKNSLDEDTEKRLASRRQRKRAKREIVECKVSKEGVTGTLAESKAATKCKKAPDIPLGLTLMYGFTTNNIGSGRLTMEPPSRSIGVFSKGKSSTSTKIH
ncbi:hypothetical protein BDQ17DRAFT_284417 [Cyathus striatus]|nr:hypothetical protein BDQ17DRAFT_284417 [Cyathus striatus]